MKITLEAQAVLVQLDDPHFQTARMWRGHTEDGTPVMALIACVESREPSEQPRVDAALREMPPPALFVSSAEASCLNTRRIA